MYVENSVRFRIREVLKLIQKHTCITFKRSRLAASSTSAARRFLVVFSKLGKRYAFMLT